jgi:hypothetical protein
MLAEDVSEQAFLDIARHPGAGVVSPGLNSPALCAMNGSAWPFRRSTA